MEELLSGGNMNTVYRVDDTVTREAGPWTPTVHRYLRYVRQTGITSIPEPLGNKDGRETLSYIHGDVPEYPLPGWVWNDSVLTDGARFLRSLHDASIGFALEDAHWQSSAKVPSEVICHNDFAPHNLTFDDGTLTGAIDFDMCSPGPRIWDIAYFATRAVPLTEHTPVGAPSLTDARRRVSLILDSYGSHETWNSVVKIAIIRLLELADFSEAKAVELSKPRLIEEANDYRRDAAFLRLHSDDL